MRFSYWPAPYQPWDEVLALAEHVEETGWDGIWYADHFMPNNDDVSQPWGECWTTLSALGARVQRLRIGPLVMGNTYRHPAILAKMAATLDHITDGRVVLGIGAGWQENEHRAYGIPFYDVPGRLRRLEEACRVIKGLFNEERCTVAGDAYQLQDAPLEPKPLQQPLPLLVGGGGEKVTLRIAAQYADEWNVWGTVDVLKHKMSVLDEHCEQLGRDPDQIECSAVALLFLGDDEAALSALRERGTPMPSMIGTPSQLQETVAAYREAGVDELIIPAFNLGPSKAHYEILDRFQQDVVAGI